MSGDEDALAKLIKSSATQGTSMSLLPVLEALLESRDALMEARLELKATPPPQVIIRHKAREIMMSRDALGNKLPVLYEAFTKAFDLATPEASTIETWESRSAKYYIHVPMKLYATFLQGKSADGIYREIPDWEGESWLGLVPTIDSVQVFTLSEHLTELQRREKEADLAKVQATLAG